MGTVTNLREWRDREDWREVFSTDSPNSTLQIYVNNRTGEAEIVQQNDDNETIRTPLSFEDTVGLLSSVSLAIEKGRALK